MDWLQPKRRGPEWKQGWTEKTLTSISAPSFHLLAVFLIVIFLLWCSTSSDPGHRTQLDRSMANLQLLLFLSPVLLILLMAVSSAASWRFNIPTGGRGLSSSLPWGVGSLVVLLLVLISYQSSFQSMWFGPLRRPD